jgi:hypothetical protein
MYPVSTFRRGSESVFRFTEDGWACPTNHAYLSCPYKPTCSRQYLGYPECVRSFCFALFDKLTMTDGAAFRIRARLLSE